MNQGVKLEEIIEDGPIDEEEIAYLINSIYFKGIWNQEFEEGKTRQDTFYGSKGDVPVDMMENKAEYKFAVSETMKSLTMEYRDGDYLFHEFLPTDDKSLKDHSIRSKCFYFGHFTCLIYRS